MKLGVSGITALLALATGCAGSAGISCEVHAPGTPELAPAPAYAGYPDQFLLTGDHACHGGDTECWTMGPSTGMPSGYVAPQQSFAGVLEPSQRVTR